MLLESMIDEENKKSNRKKKIPVQKVKVFCKTRWIQRHVVLEEVQLLYEPILQTLDTITSEKGWDHKTVDLANGLLKNIYGIYISCGIKCVFIHSRLHKAVKFNATRYSNGCD